MKKVRALKDGLAILLAILIVIYIASLFFKFKPDEVKVENGISKLYQFFKGNETNCEYIRLAFFLFLSGIAGIIFYKQPGFTVFISSVVFAYTLTAYTYKQLSKRPMVIIMLALMHLLGNIFYCAMYEKTDNKNHSSYAAASCLGGALFTSAITVVFQQRLDSVRTMTEEMAAKNITIDNPLSFYPDLVTLIYNKFKNFGTEEARLLITDFKIDLEVSTLKKDFLNTVTLEQKKDYLIISVIIFIVIFLILKFAKKYKIIPFLGSCITCGWIFFGMLSDKFSSLTLALLSLSLTALICSFVNLTKDVPIEDDIENCDDVSDEDGTDSTENETGSSEKVLVCSDGDEENDFD